ncbi:MAG: hypothetical protein M1445_08140 [Bacteroidetes bacterium]|nr:hypothetical protein [Bacteroidota bacterium]MCL6100960.1 hypothetical protein [Bacteroidota bacterium]
MAKAGVFSNPLNRQLKQTAMKEPSISPSPLRPFDPSTSLRDHPAQGPVLHFVVPSSPSSPSSQSSFPQNR